MRVSVFIDSMISSVLADFKAILAPLVGLACFKRRGIGMKEKIYKGQHMQGSIENATT